MSDALGFAEIDEPEIEQLPGSIPPALRAGVGRGAGRHGAAG
jgi:hypothetical protein